MSEKVLFLIEISLACKGTLMEKHQREVALRKEKEEKERAAKKNKPF